METLLFNVENQVATISFNRPERMNSFNKKMADELQLVTQQVRDDRAIRAVLLNGTGKLFMAGGDLQFFLENLQTMPRGVLQLVRELNTTILNLMEMPKPVLASVHGSVAGAGMSLMMACDLVIASDDTKFTMAYSGIGISPDGGATYNLPRLVGAKKAMEWLLLSDIFDAKTAQQCGLINWTVPSEERLAMTQQIITKLAKGPTQSYANTKRLVNECGHWDFKTHLEQEAKAFESCTTTTDFRNGVTAFLKKAKAEFIGE